MLKFDPPTMTIVYHFERNDKERFYHEIPLEKRMLETVDNEEICSHLFLSEAYYFNPKQIPRKQVIRDSFNKVGGHFDSETEGWLQLEAKREVTTRRLQRREEHLPAEETGQLWRSTC